MIVAFQTCSLPKGYRATISRFVYGFDPLSQFVVTDIIPSITLGTQTSTQNAKDIRPMQSPATPRNHLVVNQSGETANHIQYEKPPDSIRRAGHSARSRCSCRRGVMMMFVVGSRSGLAWL